MKQEQGPDAWMVECPMRSEYDALVFTDKQAALDKIDEYIDDTDTEGWALHPLYRGKPEWVKR